MTILAMVLGIFWGALEALVGGLLHLGAGAISGYIMGSFGMFILHFGWKKGLKYDQLVLVGLIAGAFKFSDVLIFNLPILAPQIIKPVISIVSQSFFFVVAASIMDNRVKLFFVNYEKNEFIFNYFKTTLATLIITLSFVY